MFCRPCFLFLHQVVLQAKVKLTGGAARNATCSSQRQGSTSDTAELAAYIDAMYGDTVPGTQASQ